MMDSGHEDKITADDVKAAVENFQALSEAFKSNIVAPLVKIAVAIDELAKPVREALGKITPEQWTALANIAKTGIEEYQRRLDEEEAHVVGILVSNGWLGLEKRFNITDIRKMLTIHDNGGDAAVNKFILDFFQGSDFGLLKTMTDSWMNIPYLEERRHVLSDALDAHKKGLYTLTIPSLLPFAEGLSSEILGQGQKYSVNAVTALAMQIRDAEIRGQLFSEIVCETFYKSYKFGKQDAPYLNRHGILHGRTSEYATEANSLRVFLFLDVLADMWVDKDS